MPRITRRSLIGGATGTLAAASLAAVSQAQEGKPLTGKAVLVTGTSSGFGRLGAEHYARLGAKVFATMRNLPRPEAAELRALAEREGLDLTVLELDVLSDGSVASAVAEAERLAGGALDVVVNNAGIVIGGPVEVHDMEATKLAFDTNVFGMQRVHRAVLPAMRARKAGLIVNISSQVGRVIFPSMGLYSATKHAVESMSEQLAYELAPHGIEVLIIEPGGYPTEVGQNRAKYTNALFERIDEQHAAGYPELVKRMEVPASAQTWPGAPDPMDIPNKIAQVAAMVPGSRPLRVPVHPKPKPQAGINDAARDAQLALLGDGTFGPWAKAVLD